MGLANHISLNSGIRGKFADEVMYEQLYSLPQSTSSSQILRSFSKMAGGDSSKDQPLPLSIYGMHFAESFMIDETLDLEAQLPNIPFPLNVHSYHSLSGISSKSAIKRTPKSKKQENRDDPAIRMAFSSRLDAAAREIETMNTKLHQFYECRVASLERFVAFCVMFHSLAIHCNRPWFCFGWNIARSQSNLRVATTGFCYLVVLLLYMHFVNSSTNVSFAGSGK